MFESDDQWVERSIGPFLDSESWKKYHQDTIKTIQRYIDNANVSDKDAIKTGRVPCVDGVLGGDPVIDEQNPLTAQEVLEINARFYEQEMTRGVDCGDLVFQPPVALDIDDVKGVDQPDFYDGGALLRQATVAFTCTGAPSGTIASNQATHAVARATLWKARPWPQGAVLDNDSVEAKLPRDIASNWNHRFKSGRSIPKLGKMVVCDDDNYIKKGIDFETLKCAPETAHARVLPGKTAMRRMVALIVLLSATRHNCERRLIQSMIIRAIRNEAHWRATHPLRDLLKNELLARKNRSSRLVSFASGEDSVEFGDALLPYISAADGFRLTQTCKALHTWCKEHGRELFLNLKFPDITTEYNDDGFGVNRTEDGTVQLYYGGITVLKPVVCCRFLSALPGVGPSASTLHEFPTASAAVSVNDGSNRGIWFDTSIEVALVRDDNADPSKRTVINRTADYSPVRFGVCKDLRVIKNHARELRKRHIPWLKLRMESIPKDQYSDDPNRGRFRLRLRLNIVYSNGRYTNKASTMTVDTEPFVCVAQPLTEWQEESKKRRSEEESRKRTEWKGHVDRAFDQVKSSKGISSRRKTASGAGRRSLHKSA